jgi:transposase-like protein
MTDDGGDVTALALPAATVGVAGHRRRARRSWTLGEKLAIVREIAESGDPVAEVARRHGMNANQLFTWRQMARAGSLGGRGGASPPRPMRFVDLGVVGAPAPLADGAEARIEIELPNGVIVRVPVSAAGEPLRMALASARAAL